MGGGGSYRLETSQHQNAPSFIPPCEDIQNNSRTRAHMAGFLANKDLYTDPTSDLLDPALEV